MPAKVLRMEPLGERKVSALGVEEQRVKVVLSLQNSPKALGCGYRVDARVTVGESGGSDGEVSGGARWRWAE